MPTAPTRRVLALHGILGALGVVAIALIARSVGTDALLSVLRCCAPYLPVLFAIEAARVGVETLATYLLSPRVRAHVPLVALARMHLLGYAMSCALPGGRAASEAAKGAMLAPRIGGANAAAIAATNQSLSLFAGAFISVVCAIASWIELGPSAVSWACFVSACMTALGFGALVLATRMRSIGGLLARRFARLRAATEPFHEALGELPVLHKTAAAMWVIGRCLQTLELGLLVHAVGGPFRVGTSLIAEGVIVAGGAAGDFIPGQLGATDGAFALAASSLHLTVADAVAVAVIAHVVQLAAVVVGATAPLWWRDAPRRHPIDRVGVGESSRDSI